MITLLSPAKIQNYKPQKQVSEYTQPLFLEKSEKLMEKLRMLSISEIAQLLQVNFKIAEQVHNQHIRWNKNHTPQNAKQTAWVFNGEAYRGLDIASFSEEDIYYAQKHFRIFSGLYGILHPLDLMQPYRIDVADDVASFLNKNLYEFWKKEVNRTLIQMLEESNEAKVILNLMSKEYTKVLDRKALRAKIMDVEFLQYQPDTEKYKPIVVYIKKARGMMARFALKNRITQPEDLKAFSEEGYWFNEPLSTENKFVFTR